MIRFYANLLGSHGITRLVMNFIFWITFLKREEFLADLFLQEQVNSASIFFEILNCDETSDLVNESLSSTKN